MIMKNRCLSPFQRKIEIYIMTHHDVKHKAKLFNQRIAGIWVAFAVGHPVETYRILNPKTQKSLTRNVTFLSVIWRVSKN